MFHVCETCRNTRGVLGQQKTHLGCPARNAGPQHIGDYGRIEDPFNWWIDRFQVGMFGSASFVRLAGQNEYYSDLEYRDLHGHVDVERASQTMISTFRVLDMENRKSYSRWTMMSSIRS